MRLSTTKDVARNAKLFHALADETRLQIIERLCEGELCVCDLTEFLRAAQSRLSFHLKTLKEAGLVQDRRDGRWVYYSLDREALSEETSAAEWRESFERGIAAKRWFVLEEGGVLKAMGAFNARTPDAVQLGGIYTPPEGRNRGAASRLVAGMLKQSGTERGVLFAKDPAAIRSYLAVGFRECGNYGLAFLK